MDQISNRAQLRMANGPSPSGPGRAVAILGALAVVAAAGGVGYWQFRGSPLAGGAAADAPPVTVSAPLQKDVDSRLGFLGQFSAIDRVELRAQVGGTLTGIHFKDGQIVHKGDLLFTIDPRPYEIKLAQARAQLKTAEARVALANNQLSRAQSLRRNEFASQETVDQRTNDQDASQAAVDDAKARVQDAELDLEYSRVTAPFTGKSGARQVSIGGLIAGSRSATSPTTLLVTLVSLDPIYLDFDMSEADYLQFVRERAHLKQGGLGENVVISLNGEGSFNREGKLDFLDNALNRSSGTIHARATVQNPDLLLAPGQFARLRVAVAPPKSALLLPDAAVLLDQSQHLVMTVSADNKIVPKIVQTGDMRGGLRIIKSGLSPDDRVVIDGLVRAQPGAKVTPQQGSVHYDMAADGQNS